MSDLRCDQWLKRMFDAGWRFWLWQEPGVMWRHADSYVSYITVSKAHEYAAKGIIPDPYKVAMDKRDEG